MYRSRRTVVAQVFWGIYAHIAIVNIGCSSNPNIVDWIMCCVVDRGAPRKPRYFDTQRRIYAHQSTATHHSHIKNDRHVFKAIGKSSGNDRGCGDWSHFSPIAACCYNNRERKVREGHVPVVFKNHRCQIKVNSSILPKREIEIEIVEIVWEQKPSGASSRETDIVAEHVSERVAGNSPGKCSFHDVVEKGFRHHSHQRLVCISSATTKVNRDWST